MPAGLAHVSISYTSFNAEQELMEFLVIYGFILVFILQSFVGASLAEFVSAYPTEGGMYHWIAAIAPKRYNSLLSFATGWCTVFGCKDLSNLRYESNEY